MNAGTAAPSASLEVALAHAERLLQADPALAVEQAKEILQAIGPYPPAQLLLARADAACDRHDQAIETLRQLMRALT